MRDSHTVISSIQLSDTWRPHRGVGYGLSQSVLTGEITAQVADQFDIEKFRYFVATLTETMIDTELTGDAITPALIQLLLDWHCAIQRQQKIPVFDQCYLEETNPDPSFTLKRFFIVVPCASASASVKVLDWVTQTTNFYMNNHALGQDEMAFAIQQKLNNLLVELREYAVNGVNMFPFLEHAHRMGIPFRYMANGTYSFGIGARKRLLRSSLTDSTSAIGTSFAQSKLHTAHVLRQAGLPAPTHARARDANHAVRLADELSYPVVVKPDNEEQGRGVSAGLVSPQQVIRAWQQANALSEDILVEKHVNGEDYRLTVFNGSVVKIMRRRAGGVIGDGNQTIIELVRCEQQTQRMQDVLRQTGKMLLDVDEESICLLKEQGYDQKSIPLQGVYVKLRRKCNISAGGSFTILDASEVHPDNLALAIRAARAVNLDLAGVDLIMPDIRKSWMTCDVVIPEVNAVPQIGVSVAPDLYPLILDQLVTESGRISVHLVIYASGEYKPDEADMQAMAADSECNGVSMQSGVWIDGRCVTRPQANSYVSASILLMDTGVRAAVCVMSADDIVEHGLPVAQFDRVTVIMGSCCAGADRFNLDQSLAMLRPHCGEIVMQQDSEHCDEP